MNRALTAILLLTMTACMTEEPEAEIGSTAEASSIWMDPKLHGAKINANISSWRRDFEVQAMLAHKVIFENPTITSITPATANRGQLITINGTNFTRMTMFGQVYSVSFQAGAVRSLVAATSMTSTRITVVVPANATTGTVRLINPNNGNSIWAESPLPLTVNIPAPTTGTVRFTNDSQYDVLSLTVNGMEMLPVGQIILPAGWIEVVAPGSTLPFHADLGFGFTIVSWDGSVTFTNGVNSTQSLWRVRAADIFTLGASYAWFDGPWYDNNFAPHAQSMKIYNNGTYELWQDGFFIGSANYNDGAFNPGSSVINININAQTIGFDVPYATFRLHNGPPVWPDVDYTRR